MCIDKDDVCNDHIDCPHGEDEADCEGDMWKDIHYEDKCVLSMKKTCLLFVNLANINTVNEV